MAVADYTSGIIYHFVESGEGEWSVAGTIRTGYENSVMGVAEVPGSSDEIVYVLNKQHAVYRGRFC